MTEVSQVTTSNDDGSTHVVSIGELRVMIVCDGPSEWYAQGMEIDYIAQGDTKDMVKEAFETGLAATISAHLEQYGSIRHLLRIAPQEAWAEFYENASHCAFSQVTVHRDSSDAEETVLVAKTSECPQPSRLPFDRIAYYEKNQAA
jgi:hypothetical protein